MMTMLQETISKKMVLAMVVRASAGSSGSENFRLEALGLAVLVQRGALKSMTELLGLLSLALSNDAVDLKQLSMVFAASRRAS